MAQQDAQLVERWRDGDESARDALLAEHYTSIRRFFEVKAPAVAADLTQQTFLTCIEQLAKLQQAASFRAYLFGIARNLLLRHFRAAAQSEQRVTPYETTPGAGPTLTGIVAKHQTQWLVLRALEKLPLDMRIALELHYWEGMTSSEVAAVLKIPESTVTTRLSRARTRLSDAIVKLEPKRASVELEDLESWTRSLVASAS